MRFCMVTTFYPPFNFGGDGVFVQQLARDLVAAGHEVEVVHCKDAWRLGAAKLDPDPGGAAVEGADDGIVVHTLESSAGALSPLVTQQTGRPGLKAGALEAVLARGFDVVNFHNVSLIGGPGVLRLGSGVKLFTLHEHWWVCPTHVLWRYTGELCTQPSCLRCCLHFRTPPQLWRRARGWMGRCLEEVDALLAPSRFTADRHRAWMEAAGVDVPIEVLPEYTPPLPAAEARPPGLPERYFLFVGRLERVKGVEPLLDAFAARPDYPIVLVGTGDAEADLRARRLRNAHFVGRVPREQLGAYYRAAEALVFPTLCAETFGLTAVEALSCGTPVISSRCGGTEEIVDPEVGFTFGAPGELLAALDRIWDEPGLAARLGAAGGERYRARFTPEVYLEGYLEAVERRRTER